MIVKLLARDVRFGLPFLTFSLLAAPLLGVLFSIGSAGDIVYAGESLSAYTLGDFLAIAFNFSVPLDLWNLIQGRPLSITFSWFFPMAVMLSSLLEYPRADAFGAGYRAVLAWEAVGPGGSRSACGPAWPSACFGFCSLRLSRPWRVLLECRYRFRLLKRGFRSSARSCRPAWSV